MTSPRSVVAAIALWTSTVGASPLTVIVSVIEPGASCTLTLS